MASLSLCGKWIWDKEENMLIKIRALDVSFIYYDSILAFNVDIRVAEYEDSQQNLDSFISSMSSFEKMLQDY